MESTSSLVALSPGGSLVGIAGGIVLLFGQEQAEITESCTVARFSLGHDTGTDGKSCGIAPRPTNASRHKNALPILSDTYTNCFVERVDPETSLVDISAIIPPSTPISSDIAPRMERVTGKMSSFEIPIASAVLRGMIEL